MKLAKNIKKWILKQKHFCRMQYFIKYLCFCEIYFKFLKISYILL